MESSSSTTSSLGIRFGLRQFYPHGCPHALLGANRDLAAHSLHEILADRQAEARTAREAFPRVEALEDVGEILLRYASCSVLDGHRGPRETQSHHLAAFRMLDGIGYGDQERLLEQRGIGDNPCCLPFHGHLESCGLGQGIRHPDRDMGNLREIGWFQLRFSPAPADASE